MKNLDLLHQPESSFRQPVNINMDTSGDAVRREDLAAANMGDVIGGSVSNSADSTNEIINQLKNQIKDDENIAVKSAILLRLLEVSTYLFFPLTYKLPRCMYS